MVNGKLGRFHNIDPHYDKQLSTEVTIYANGRKLKVPNIAKKPDRMRDHRSPRVSYVNIGLSTNYTDTPAQVKALHDSGCAKTVMHQRLLRTLEYQPTLRASPNTYISSCTGEKTTPIGNVDLFLTMTGQNGNEMKIRHNILVLPDLDYDFLLGRDFTGSEYKIMETNEHIYLTEFTEHNNISDLWENKHVDLKIENVEHQKVQQLTTNSETIIQPFSMAVVNCRPKNNSFRMTKREQNKQVFFEVCNVQIQCLRSPLALHNASDTTAIHIPLFNPTDQEVLIAARTYIADIKELDDICNVFYLNTLAEIPQDFPVFSSSLDPNMDPDLTEEEKEKMFIEYLETGKYTPSMSSYIENSPSITEMSFKNVRPWSEEEFEAQFDLDHLSPRERQKVLQVLHKYRHIFSRHEMDIGCASNIEMEIEVDNSKPRIQKYYPLPFAVREQTKAILDQMLEYGLL